MRQPPHPQAGGGSGNPPAEDGGIHDATTRVSAEQTEPDDGDEARARANNQTDGEGRAQAEKHAGALAPTALPEPVYGRGGLTARER